jgi:hypothetical protein
MVYEINAVQSMLCGINAVRNMLCEINAVRNLLNKVMLYEICCTKQR